MYIKLILWNKPQKLKVVFDLPKNEYTTMTQTQAYNMFMQNKKKIIPEIEQKLVEDFGNDPLSIIMPTTFYVQRTDDRVISIICEKINSEDDYIISIKNEKDIKIDT